MVTAEGILLICKKRNVILYDIWHRLTRRLQRLQIQYKMASITFTILLLTINNKGTFTYRENFVFRKVICIYSLKLHRFALVKNQFTYYEKLVILRLLLTCTGSFLNWLVMKTEIYVISSEYGYSKRGGSPR